MVSFYLNFNSSTFEQLKFQNNHFDKISAYLDPVPCGDMAESPLRKPLGNDVLSMLFTVGTPDTYQGVAC